MPKGPSFTIDEKFKFLVSCIRWSNNGKIDYAHVAEENGLPTKMAAYLRFYRIMKAHGIVFGGKGDAKAKAETEKTEPRIKAEAGTSPSMSARARARTPVKKEDDDIFTTAAAPSTPLKRERVDDDVEVEDEATPKTTPRTIPRKRQKKASYADDWFYEDEDTDWLPSY